jgi:hypothetical protein
MRKEQLANIISYLESIKEKDGDYKKYIETLDLLASRLLSYYTPNIQGKYMDITQEEYDELDNLFKDALQKSESFSESKFADEKNEAAREIKNNINEKLHKEFLTDFYADFKQVDINSGKSFYEEMQKNKKVVVQVENEPIIDNQEAIEPKEEKKEEKKEEEPKEETPPENPVSLSIIPVPDGSAKTILCTHNENTSTGTPYVLNILAYYDRAGGTMNKVQIYTAVEGLNLTVEERTELATLLEREMKNKYTSFTATHAVTETESQVLLNGTPENLLSDYKVLDNSSLEYYNYAPTLRYEGFTCTIN